MADKCYRVQFTAHLHKLTLALKMACEIQVIWKRGQKVCESGKVSLVGGEAKFDRKISISCNMIFNTKQKIFKQKITKFSIILTSQKGVKQAGDIQFDVAEYINQKQLNKKQYEQRLSNCPDKNAKLSFSLTGVLRQQLSMDSISQSSYLGTENTNTNTNTPEPTRQFSKILPSSQNIQQPPTSDKQKQQPKNQKIKAIQQQNRRMKQQLKTAQKLKQQNQQMRRKIKNEDFKKAAQLKQKIQKYKKQVQKIKSEIRANKKIQDQTAEIQKNILNCKIKIMKAFNYADQYRGAQLVDAIQNYCGIQEK